MAPSAKFVSVNLNKSYGQSSSSFSSSSSSSASSVLSRSRSYGGSNSSSISHGGMVSLSRPSTRFSSSSSSVPSPLPRMPSSSSSSSSSLSSSSLKLSVPRPVNLPSLRREHAGNDPTVSLVTGSAGSSHGWIRQTTEENQQDPLNRPRTEALKITDTVKGNAVSSLPSSSFPSLRTSASSSVQGKNGGHEAMGSAYTPPGSRPSPHTHSIASSSSPSSSLVSHMSIEKAVVFRGEDFPSLQASVPSPGIPLQYRQQQRDAQPKQQEKPFLMQSESKKSHHNQEESQVSELISTGPESTGIEPRRTESRLDSHGQEIFQKNADDGSRVAEEGRGSRGPSPLIRLSHISNWADDERETLSSFQPQERSQLGHGETYSTLNNWAATDHGDTKRPTSRNGYLGRNDADMSAFIPKNGYNKDASQFANNGSRFERDHRGGDFDRLDVNAGGRNDYLKRGWSFSAAELTGTRDSKVYSRVANIPRNDAFGSEFSSRDTRQGQEYRSSKNVYGKLGGSGVHGLQGERNGRGSSFLYAPSDVSMPRKSNPMGSDYNPRERRNSSFREQIRNEDPFLGDIMDTRVGSFMGSVGLDVKVARMKKEPLKDENVRDLARESFEAELERVQKMLELESQRAAEEQERAIELARKEQEERERIAREEEEMRQKLEEEAREEALRAEREAEEAARRVEELRRVREEEKRMAALEEERRKEAARKKLLEIEERMARRQEQSMQKQGIGSGEEVALQRNNELVEKESQGKFMHGSSKDDQEDGAMHGQSSKLPSILKSPFGPSNGKEGHGFSTQRSRYPQEWKRESFDIGQEAHSTQQGSTRSTHTRGDFNHADYDEQRSFRSITRSPAMNGDTHDRAPSNNPRDKDVGNWWIRDDPSRLEPPVESYGTEYPPFGRLRQSLPKQPRVLPPPPGPIMVRKQHFQSDHNESKSESSVIGISSSTSEDISRKDSSAEIAIEAVVSHKMNKEEDVVDMAVSKQFENVPSEEVVLSDAVSQFSDDTLEDERDSTGQMYQDQDSHSDMVSETYSEDVDEISDLTDAQTSSEEVEASTELQTSKEEEPRENNAKEIGEARNEIEVKVEDGKTINRVDKLLVKGEDISIGEDGGKLHLVKEDEVHKSGENNGYKGVEETRNAEEKFVSFVPVDTQTGPKGLATQKAVQDQVMHHYSHHIPFLSMSTMDASQIGHHSEGLGSRQSLVQQFQQPFSFMAVPLPQPSNLNNVPANQPLPSSTQGLQNQQDMPFLQLGLLSGVPLMPNAIQIGSIQMPLHIHPHIPQYAQLHGQQQPIFQFGQIGHTGPISHTSILQPGLQIHTTVGQNMLPQHHQLQSECVHVKETVNVASNSEQLVKMDVDAVEQVQSIKNMSTSQSDEHVEGNQAASSMVPQDRVKDSSVGERADANSAKPHWARNRASNVDAYGGKPGGYIRKDLNAVSGRQSRGRRRHDASSYQGILGRGRGRFRSGQNNRSQGSHVVESWPERGPKRGVQGRIYHKSTHRLEYKVRAPLPPIDGEPATAEITEGLAIDFTNKDGSGEVAKGVIVNKDAGSHPKGGDYDMNKMNAYSGGQPKHASVKAPTQNDQASNKGLHKRYEVDSPEDAPLRNGVVYVFEQPGIETQNDKDDFIEVRSKRQLLREQREQREKDNKAKSMDSGVPKTQRSTMKAGVVNSNRSNTKKSFGQGNEMHSIDNRPMASQRRTGTGNTVSQTSAITAASHAISSTRGTKIKSKPSDSLKKSTSTLPKLAGQASSPSNVVSIEAAGLGGYQLESRGNEPSISTAWGGQRSNQEVISFTQIQLEEAMKPFRLEGHFPDQSHIPERAPVLLDTGIPHIVVSGSEKSTIPINVPGSISSLLAGEKIQFGAVTSSPPIPSSSPLSPLSNAQMMELRSETTRVSHFLESDGETVFTAKEKHGGVHDSFQVKVIDLEAEAEAAASAVAVAAISNEDVIQSHSVLGSGGINGDDTHSIPTTSGLRPVVIQALNNGSNDNPISVSLPADLLVEMPPPLYQASPISLPASSGVMLQSLPGGAPPYPCLEMGPMLGGPIFTYGPREDASFASMDTGLAGWQQRHLGTPDSFYGTSPFMNPAGLSGIQGHPHMVVYANPFTPVGQFGQLGVGFMGATYHPSKQPDWTHIPISSSSSSSGALGLNDGEINAGMMASRHTNGVSNPNAPQQLSVPGPSIMPLSTPSVFEAGLSAPFQSHWSKAPAPPVSSMAISGSAQTGSVVGSTLDLTQPHLSRVVQNQMGHIAHLMDVSSGFNELPVLKPVARSSFSSSDATPQFPDELGLGETPATTPSGNSLLLNDLGVEGSISVGSSAGKLGRQNRRAPRPPHGGKGGLNITSEHEQIEFQKHHSKNSSIRMGPPSAGRASPPIPFPDTRARASQQNTATTDSVRTEWLGGNQRRGTSGRFVPDRVSTGQSSKVKQIYVPKSTTSASTKLGAIADSAYRL